MREKERKKRDRQTDREIVREKGGGGAKTERRRVVEIRKRKGEREQCRKRER